MSTKTLQTSSIPPFLSIPAHYSILSPSSPSSSQSLPTTTTIFITISTQTLSSSSQLPTIFLKVIEGCDHRFRGRVIFSDHGSTLVSGDVAGGSVLSDINGAQKFQTCALVLIKFLIITISKTLPTSSIFLLS